MPLIEKLSASDLKRWIDDHRDFVLLDVAPPEIFQQHHLPGALNACVYEITFVDHVRQLLSDPKKSIVVYGSSTRSLASSTAATKLTHAGYEQIHDFSGGLEAWREHGFPIEGNPAPDSSQPSLPDKNYEVDPSQSLIEWTGRNLGNKHWGTIQIAAGDLQITQGRLTGGHFVIDLTTITNTNLTDPSLRQVLIDHLKSDDFFDVANHPRARFVITSSDPIPDATPGRPNHQITGTLTLKSVPHDIQFKAIIAPTKEGNLTAQAQFDFDRTNWNVLFGSGKFFENLGMHLVNDFINLQIKLIAV